METENQRGISLKSTVSKLIRIGSNLVLRKFQEKPTMAKLVRVAVQNPTYWLVGR